MALVQWCTVGLVNKIAMKRSSVWSWLNACPFKLGHAPSLLYPLYMQQERMHKIT